MEPILQQRDCPFCHRVHFSEFVDVLEEQVLRCREKANRIDLGLLEDVSETVPKRCEDYVSDLAADGV